MDELYHHGILGMKWGRRRYQNKDGSLTPAGKKRYSSKEDTSNMSEEELRNNINRLRMEREYLDLKRQVNSLTPKELSAGRIVVNGAKEIKDQLIIPVIRDSGKTVLTRLLSKQGSKALGLDKK